MDKDLIQVTRLANGLTVATDRVHGVHSAAIGVWIAAGARYEDPEREGGLAHLAEHMLFKGTPTRSAADIAHAVEAYGGDLNAYTGREVTAYHAHVLAEDAPHAADVLADMIRRSTLPEDELAREKAVVLQEIGMCADTPDDRVHVHAYTTAWPGQALGAPVLGTVQTVQTLTREAIMAYTHRAYRPERMVLYAAGGVKHGAVVDLAQDHFGDMQAGPALAYPAPARYAGGELRENKALEQAHVFLAFPGVARDDPEYYAVQALAIVLGGGAASRLFQEIREKRGLVYTVSAFHAAYRDTGLFGIYAGTGPESLADLTPVACDEVTRLADTLTEAETTRARAQMRARLLMGREYMLHRADMGARHLLLKGQALDVASLVAKIEAVDAPAIARAARRVFAGRPTLAALGPIGALESYDALADRLKRCT
ncbi:MAG TPA: peptidase M16 [Rhodospirillaceae bacterium]|jgi:predicted Zn-dependent peptidase|nr:insulinase family protein [Alphaproteobacteria bacterium]HBH25954.1 peptidase M16 [Rhodospirillaceae bacterium]